jgi:hypothetical protein
MEIKSGTIVRTVGLCDARLIPTINISAIPYQENRVEGVVGAVESEVGGFVFHVTHDSDGSYAVYHVSELQALNAKELAERSIALIKAQVKKLEDAMAEKQARWSETFQFWQPLLNIAYVARKEWPHVVGKVKFTHDDTSPIITIGQHEVTLQRVGESKYPKILKGMTVETGSDTPRHLEIVFRNLIAEAVFNHKPGPEEL